MPDTTDGPLGVPTDSFPVDFDSAVSLISYRLEDEIVSFPGEYDGMDGETDEYVGSFWELDADHIIQVLGDLQGHVIYRSIAYSLHPSDLGSPGKLRTMTWGEFVDRCDRAKPRTLLEHGIDPDDDSTVDIDHDRRTEAATAREEAYENEDEDTEDEDEETFETGELRLDNVEVEPQFHVENASLFIHELGCEAIEVEADYDNERLIIRPHGEEVAD